MCYEINVGTVCVYVCVCVCVCAHVQLSGIPANLKAACIHSNMSMKQREAAIEKVTHSAHCGVEQQERAGTTYRMDLIPNILAMHKLNVCVHCESTNEIKSRQKNK